MSHPMTAGLVLLWVTTLRVLTEGTGAPSELRAKQLPYSSHMTESQTSTPPDSKAPLSSATLLYCYIISLQEQDRCCAG